MTYIRGWKKIPGANRFRVKEKNPFYRWYLSNELLIKGKTVEVEE